VGICTILAEKSGSQVWIGFNVFSLHIYTTNLMRMWRTTKDENGHFQRKCDFATATHMGMKNVILLLPACLLAIFIRSDMASVSSKEISIDLSL